jgi:condensin-2 complex subunit D3
VIYTALLRHMSPEHKFATAAKLCTEVLAGVADGLLPLPECEEVLGDALRVLAAKEIKVGGGGGRGRGRVGC